MLNQPFFPHLQQHVSFSCGGSLQQLLFCLKANETTRHQAAKWLLLSRHHLCADMSRFPGSWGFNQLIRHQAMAEWVLNGWWLSFHCPLCDHFASFTDTARHFPAPVTSPITKPTSVFIIKFRLQALPLTLSLPPHALLSSKPRRRCCDQGLGVRSRFLHLGEHGTVEIRADIFSSLWRFVIIGAANLVCGQEVESLFCIFCYLYIVVHVDRTDLSHFCFNRKLI